MSIHRKFARVWLLAMTVALVLATGINLYDGGPWAWSFFGSILLSGVITWVVWFIVVLTMPWIERG